MNQDDSFEDDDWIPLEPGSPQSYAKQQDDTSSSTPRQTIDVSKSSALQPTRFKQTLKDIRDEHGRNQTLKNGLVNHPLTRLPMVFTIHLLKEIWSSHYSIRLGIFFIVFGLCTQTTSLTILFYISLKNLPKLVICTVIIMFSTYLYISPHAKEKFQEWRLPENMQDAVLTFLENVNGRILRRIVIVIVCIVPLLLEMVALIFLSRLVGNNAGGWFKFLICFAGICLECTALLSTHFDVEYASETDESGDASSQDNIGNKTAERKWTSGEYSLGSILILRKPESKLSDCRVQAWISLYAMALLALATTMDKDQTHTTILLAGPFLIASGIFLVLSTTEDKEGEDLWMNLLRRALRKTLRDILQEVGDNVAEDEMLRMAMLRWIVDYWAKPSSSDATTSGTNTGGGRAFNFTSSSNEDRATGARAAAQNTAASSSSNEVGDARSRAATQNNAASSSSNKVCTAGARAATQNNATSSSSNEVGAAGSRATAQNKAEGRNENGSQQAAEVRTSTSSHSYSRDTGDPPLSAQEPLGWEELFTMLSSTTDQMYEEVQMGQNNCNHQSDQSGPNQSVHGLKEMLSCFNGDERSKASVEMYKLAIEEIPPPRYAAVCLSLARRCPALFSIIYFLLFHSSIASLCALTLFPLLALDMMRLSDFVSACHRADRMSRLRSGRSSETESESEGDWCSCLLPMSLSPMEILLSRNDYSPFNRGSAVQIWLNVKSSVNALESGLTAMKCVHTAQVATNLAFSVMSLSKVAVEVKNEGPISGLGLVLSELFHFHLQKVSSSTTNGQRRSERNQEGRHFNTLVDIAENSQILKKNVTELMEVETVENFFSPVVSLLRGILPGKEADTSNQDDAFDQDDVPTETKQEESGSVDNDSIAETPTNTFEKALSEKSTVPHDLELDHDDSDNDCDDNDDGDDNKNVRIHSNTRGDDEESWTSINSQVSAQVPTQQVIMADREENQSTSSERHQVVESESPKHANDAMKWVGAGVAIIGTVIGGIALASNNDESSRRGPGQRNETNSRRSTVTIERLDDDE